MRHEDDTCSRILLSAQRIHLRVIFFLFLARPLQYAIIKIMQRGPDGDGASVIKRAQLILCQQNLLLRKGHDDFIPGNSMASPKNIGGLQNVEISLQRLNIKLQSDI